MRKQAFIWLIAVITFVAIFAASAPASAHSGHAHATNLADLRLSARTGVALMRGQQSPQSGAPCDCPAGHCRCSIACAAACAAVAIIAEDLQLPRSLAPPSFEIARFYGMTGAKPGVDLAPPRPIALS